MSRTAAAFINVALAQVENAANCRGVFVHNTDAAIDAALRNVAVTPQMSEQAENLRRSAAEIVSTIEDDPRHGTAKAEFIRLAADLQQSLLSLRADRKTTKRREIDGLGL